MTMGYDNKDYMMERLSGRATQKDTCFNICIDMNKLISRAIKLLEYMSTREHPGERRIQRVNIVFPLHTLLVKGGFFHTI